MAVNEHARQMALGDDGVVLATFPPWMVPTSGFSQCRPSVLVA